MKKNSFIESMRLQEIQKRERGAESTADLYRAVCNRLVRFTGKEDLLAEDITPGLVADFMEWLGREGLRVNTVNSYISNLRAMYNRYLRDFPPRKRQALANPFAALRLRREETHKRAVPSSVMEAIAKMELPEGSEAKKAMDFALFSYTACGIPFVDLAHLTRENIRDGKHLSYRRQKTDTFINMALTDEMKYLIDKYADPSSPYLFGVLREGATYADYKACLRAYNKALQSIGNRLGLEEKFTSYTIRHTWASEAHRKHISISVISQALGHTSEKMTRTYIERLDPQEISAANRQVSGHVGDLLLKRRDELIYEIS